MLYLLRAMRYVENLKNSLSPHGNYILMHINLRRRWLLTRPKPRSSNTAHKLLTYVTQYLRAARIR